VTQMRQDLNRVLGTVGGLTGGRARVLVTTYWNVFADGDVARTAERAGYLAWSDIDESETLYCVGRSCGGNLRLPHFCARAGENSSVPGFASQR